MKLFENLLNVFKAICLITFMITLVVGGIQIVVTIGFRWLGNIIEKINW